MGKNLMKENLIDLGLAGWMADFGEYTPVEARSDYAARWWGNDHGEVLHQLFSQEWANLNREVVEESGKLGEIMYWMRSGGVNSKFDQVMSWAGDQTVDWTKSDGLPSSIVSALSLATSGMGLTQIFTTLKNYTKAAVRQNSVEHTPVMRPLFLVFDNDTQSYSQDYEYMFGDDLLVAPVLEAGLTAWTVYLPGPDTWVHLWGEAEVTGPISVEVEAPLGKPPVFYRRDSPWTELFVR